MFEGVLEIFKNVSADFVFTVHAFDNVWFLCIFPTFCLYLIILRYCFKLTLFPCVKIKIP